jgi:D-alanyl-D-alanine carboxypeptidase
MMLRAGSRTAIHASVWGLIAILTIAAATPADARRHASSHRGHSARSHAHHGSGYSPPYSAIVVDANSGATLHESSPDGVRHPASLTKIMTLYLLFEQLNAGKLTLESRIEVSERAASQSPTKLGVPAGGTIAVEDAIKAIVTRSANDIACAIGEKIGGDEDTFAQMMTKKARALGMSQTVYRNASGLPDDEQVTSARDQAVLGRAIQERFPRYYRYFSTRSFTWHGHEIANHNHLLGTVEGVDGIKTGFVHASGFNLVTSVRRNGRHLVAVVMGGSSAGSRDSRMRELISQYISKGSTQHTAAAIAEGARSPVRAAAKMAPAPDGSMTKTADAPFVTASAPSAGAHPAPAVQPTVAQPATAATESQPAASRHPEATVAMLSPLVGSSDDIRPTPVRTLRVRATTIKATSIGSEPEAAHAVVPVTPAPPAAAGPQPEAESVTAAPPAPPAPPVAVARAPAPPAQRAPLVVVARAPAPPVADVVSAPVAPPVAAPAPAPAVEEALEAKPPKIFATASASAPAKPAVVTEVTAALAQVPAAQDVRDAKAPKASATAPTPIPAKPAVVAEAPAAQRSADSTEATPAHEGTTREGWLIQVGALESVMAAKERLGSAQTSAAKILKQADPFTEKVVKGDKTLYRARFAGLDKSQAEAACRALKRSDIPCMLIAAANKN